MPNEAQPDLSGLIRVEANTYPEALRQINQRFGRNVSIVHTRTIRRKGVMGMLGGTGVEVYVTGRAEYEAWRDGGGRRVATTEAGRPSIPPEEVMHFLERVHDIMVQNPHLHSTAPHPGVVASGPTAVPQIEPDPVGLETPNRSPPEGASPRTSRSDASRPIPSPGDGSSRMGPPLGAWEPRATGPPVHPVLKEARRRLTVAEFSEAKREEILEKLMRRELPGTGGEATEVSTLARIQLGELVRTRIPPCLPVQLSKRSEGPLVVALVGPTGVGKTTTIGKLASPLGLGALGPVGLVTVDTYRLGAVDQIRKFADIMNLPLRVVDTQHSIKGAVHALRDCAIVLVDTAGRSQKDARRLAELGSMLEGIAGLEIHLCVSMATSLSANLDVVRNFRAVPYGRVLITKLDEASHYGPLLDIFDAAKTPVSYLTCGQEVPDDIQAASVNRLEELLLGD